MKLKFKNKKGVTLPELLVTVLLFSIIVSAMYTMLIMGTETYQTTKIKTELVQNLRTSMDRMKADLRKAGSSSIIDVPADGSWYTSIEFRIPEGVDGSGYTDWPTETVDYSLTSTDLMRKLQDGVTVNENRTIATFIQTLQVRRLAATPHIVEVSLTAQRDTPKGNTLSSTNSFKVVLRN